MKQLFETSAPVWSTPVVELAEDKRGRKRLRFEGVFQRVGQRNENNRRYGSSVWDINLNPGSRFMRRLEARGVFGELEHPETGNTDLKRASHLVEKVWRRALSSDNQYRVPAGDYVCGSAVVLGTPNGKILEELLRVGARVGVSSRGRGNTVVSQDGVEDVQADYELDTFDVVSEPSVAEALPRVMSEADVVAAQDTGAAPPGATAPAPETPSVTGKPEEKPEPEVPEGERVSVLKKAQQVVKELERAVASDDTLAMVELLSQAADMLDQIGAPPDAELARYKGQLTSLVRVATGMIDELVKKYSQAKSEVKESVVTEQLSNLAVEVERGRRDKRGVIYKGEVENILKRYGHGTDVASVEELATALRQRGYSVNVTEYGPSPSDQERGKRMGESTATAVDVASSIAEKYAQAKQELEKLKDSVPRRRYEASVTLAESLLRRCRKEKSRRETLERRYEAAIKLIHGLVERCRAAGIKGEAVSQTKPSPVRTLTEAKPRSQPSEPIPRVTRESLERARVEATPKESAADNHPLITMVVDRTEGKKK